jgi:hypothetical protein
MLQPLWPLATAQPNYNNMLPTHRIDALARAIDEATGAALAHRMNAAVLARTVTMSVDSEPDRLIMPANCRVPAQQSAGVHMPLHGPCL